MILAGGAFSPGELGGETLPSMTPVGGKPFLSYLLWHARRFGFRRVLLLAGGDAARVAEQAGVLREAAGAVPGELDIEVVAVPEASGTGGALRFAADKLDDQFLLLNGNSIFDFNWLDLVTLDAPGVQAVMALRDVHDAARFSGVGVDGERVTHVAEPGDAVCGLVDGGVYLLSRNAALRCPARSVFERELLPALAAEGSVRGRAHTGFFLDIAAPQALDEAQNLVPASLRRPAVFFDRDGVLNVDHGYVHSVDRLDWIEGAAAAVKAVNDSGLFAFLVTNQSGVARGLYPVSAVQALHAHMQAELRLGGAHFDDVRWCPHHSEGTVAEFAHACDHRKPGPGMLLDLAERWPVDLTRSLVIGDRPTDLAAGHAAGVARGALFEGGDIGTFVRSRLAYP